MLKILLDSELSTNELSSARSARGRLIGCLDYSIVNSRSTVCFQLLRLLSVAPFLGGYHMNNERVYEFGYSCTKVSFLLLRVYIYERGKVEL